MTSELLSSELINHCQWVGCVFWIPVHLIWVFCLIASQGLSVFPDVPSWDLYILPLLHALISHQCSKSRRVFSSFSYWLCYVFPFWCRKESREKQYILLQCFSWTCTKFFSQCGRHWSMGLFILAWPKNIVCSHLTYKKCSVLGILSLPRILDLHLGYLHKCSW